MVLIPLAVTEHCCEWTPRCEVMYLPQKSIHPSEIAAEARSKTVKPFRIEKKALHSQNCIRMLGCLNVIIALGFSQNSCFIVKHAT